MRAWSGFRPICGLLLAVVAGFAGGGCRGTPPGEGVSWIGTWSAPSLSRPDTPIIITLAADGRATEEIGAYSGTGRWREEGGNARIEWASGWRGMMCRVGRGFELRTWKSGSGPEAGPDDVQRVQRFR